LKRVQTLLGQELQAERREDRSGVEEHHGMRGGRMNERLAGKDEFERKHQAEQQAAAQCPVGERAAPFACEHQ